MLDEDPGAFFLRGIWMVKLGNEHVSLGCFFFLFLRFFGGRPAVAPVLLFEEHLHGLGAGPGVAEADSGHHPN